MKKTLVLASLLAAFGAASAQSSVTLFGILDASVNSTKSTTYSAANVVGHNLVIGGTETAADFAKRVAAFNAVNGVGQTSLDSGNINGSRFGVRGSEALGGGATALFVVETVLAGDTSAATSMGNRQMFVGLSSGMGTVTAGRHYTAYDSARAAIDPTGHSAYSAVTAGGTAWGQGRSYQFRTNNSLRFDTANYSGFSAATTVSFGEDKTASASASSVNSFHAKYIAGPIVALVAMQNENNVGSAYAASGQDVGGAPAAGTKNTHTLIAGSYNFGVAKLTLGANTSKNSAAGTVADKEFQVGLNVPVGAANAVLSYATSKQAGKYSAKGVAAELHYALSPRTNTYVGLSSGKTTNTAANFTSLKTSKFGVGLRHAF